eukprot:GHVP01054930.1.p1 GENE.GHVP01054930.1~~GHVP01054930.1.p1  ORF type:complete len:216 (+),score=38.71 GHVP01054930.1:97-648(+)
MSNTEVDTEDSDVSTERMNSLKSKLCRDVTSFLQKHYSKDYQSRTIPFKCIRLTFNKMGSSFTNYFPVSELFEHNESLFLLECHICDKKGVCKPDCAIVSLKEICEFSLDINKKTNKAQSGVSIIRDKKNKENKNAEDDLIYQEVQEIITTFNELHSYFGDLEICFEDNSSSHTEFRGEKRNE